MVIKITPQQAKRVNALLRKLCANYDGGNCLLLDDGEPRVCVQSISKYGIYCNYFKNAVLPADERLHAEIMKPTGGKRCVLCRQAFASRAKNQRYCPACAAKDKTTKDAYPLQLSSDALYTLQYILTSEWSKLYAFGVSEEVLRELTHFMKRYLGRYLPHQFKSEAFLK